MHSARAATQPNRKVLCWTGYVLTCVHAQACLSAVQQPSQCPLPSQPDEASSATAARSAPTKPSQAACQPASPPGNPALRASLLPAPAPLAAHPGTAQCALHWPLGPLSPLLRRSGRPPAPGSQPGAPCRSMSRGVGCTAWQEMGERRCEGQLSDGSQTGSSFSNSLAPACLSQLSKVKAAALPLSGCTKHHLCCHSDHRSLCGKPILAGLPPASRRVAACCTGGVVQPLPPGQMSGPRQVPAPPGCLSARLGCH